MATETQPEIRRLARAVFGRETKLHTHADAVSYLRQERTGATDTAVLSWIDAAIDGALDGEL